MGEQHETKNYIQEGGDEWDIGGVLNILSGGAISVEGVPMVLGNAFKEIWLDPAGGSNGYSGLTKALAKAGLSNAYALTLDGRNDIIKFVPGATEAALAAAMDWDNSFTHLIGLGGNLPGMGQRSRIVGSAAVDLAQLVTVNGSGNVFRNLKFSNEGDAAGALGAVIVPGGRNYFQNCMFAGMAHAIPGAQAGGFSLKVTGEENFFEDCVIGLDTIIRAQANAELIVSGPRNHFRRCFFQSYSETAGKFLVKIDNSDGDLRYTVFEDCLFWNYTQNWATGITNAFSMPASGPTHTVILKGKNSLHGQIGGWADNLTHIKGDMAAPEAGFGIAISPTG